MCNRGAHGSSVRSDYMRSWSRRKLLTAVKVEGHSLVGWQGRRYEDGDPSWFLSWQGRGCWRMRRQGACSFLWHSPRVEHVMSWGAVWSCKSGLSCLSLHTAAFWVDWWRLSLRWIHQDIILSLFLYGNWVMKGFHFLFLFSSCCGDNRYWKLQRLPAQAVM